MKTLAAPAIFDYTSTVLVGTLIEVYTTDEPQSKPLKVDAVYAEDLDLAKCDFCECFMVEGVGEKNCNGTWCPYCWWADPKPCHAECYWEDNYDPSDVY